MEVCMIRINKTYRDDAKVSIACRWGFDFLDSIKGRHLAD
jgi:hypothetical protein